MSEMRLVVVGAAGRMGRELVRTIAESDGVRLVGAVDRTGSEALGQDAGLLAGIGETGIRVSDDPLALFARADGVLDFTVPEATVQFAEYAAQARIAHVVGTTGLSESDLEAIAAAARHAVVVRSGNMSLGVNLVAELTRKVAAALDAGFDIEIVEMHHRHKIDAPSGTAMMLGEAAAAGRAVSLSDVGVFAREGHTGERRRGDIGFATLRGGTVVGEHSVIFAGAGERIELTHRSADRAIFARGAVKAAQWAHGRKPGIYTMVDVLGL